jgi:hypothetical protein
MFTAFLLGSLSNVNAMYQDFPEEDGYSPGQERSKEKKSFSQEPFNQGSEDESERPDYRSSSQSFHYENLFTSGEDHFQRDQLEKEQTSKKANLKEQDQGHERDDDTFSEEGGMVSAALLGLLEPLNEHLNSSIKSDIRGEILHSGMINEYINFDQKIIYNHLPKDKILEDYSIHGTSADEDMFHIYLTSIRNKVRISDIIVWRGERTNQSQYKKPNLTQAVATSTITAVLEAFRAQDIRIFTTTGCLPAFSKEMQIPVIETAEVQMPTRIFRLNDNFETDSQKEKSNKPAVNLLSLDFLK